MEVMRRTLNEHWPVFYPPYLSTTAKVQQYYAFQRKQSS